MFREKFKFNRVVICFGRGRSGSRAMAEGRRPSSSLLDNAPTRFLQPHPVNPDSTNARLNPASLTGHDIAACVPGREKPRPPVQLRTCPGEWSLKACQLVDTRGGRMDHPPRGNGLSPVAKPRLPPQPSDAFEVRLTLPFNRPSLRYRWGAHRRTALRAAKAESSARYAEDPKN